MTRPIDTEVARVLADEWDLEPADIQAAARRREDVRVGIQQLRDSEPGPAAEELRANVMLAILGEDDGGDAACPYCGRSTTRTLLGARRHTADGGLVFLCDGSREVPS